MPVTSDHGSLDGSHPGVSRRRAQRLSSSRTVPPLLGLARLERSL